jgi:hypothetical protein
VASWNDARRAAGSAYGVLLLTSVHQVYGAVIYDTPWRLHAVYISAAAAFVIAALQLLQRRYEGRPAGRITRWLLAAVITAVPVAMIGAVEGAYNHVAKNALYFSGASLDTLHRLFPPPTYELPNDAVFEITGMLQVVPAAFAAWHVVRMLRWRKPTASALRSRASEQRKEDSAVYEHDGEQRESEPLLLRHPRYNAGHGQRHQ